MTTTSSKKHIVFDFGGVLFRWHPPSFMARIWPHRAADATQGREIALQFFENYRGAWGDFDRGVAEAHEVVERIAARTGWPRAEVQAVVDAIPAELELQAETVKLIEELKAAGHRLFFLSNMPRPLAAHLEAAHPLHEWFEGGVFSGRVRQVKPGAEIFATAIATFGVKAEDCVFLDDHPENIEAAKALGWEALLFTSAAEVRPRLMALVG
ncbi:HAD family hydrolase [Pelomonas sp. KK5]|uniref:HAD family hydrolase n=1 Tax=Pelomonas sp. KK5 TaxID=1855730 RepID=UPI00097C13EA|nr:HAD family phosphatase [Pelomonas sp. KK5]